MEELLEEYYRLVEESRIPDGDRRHGAVATQMAAAAGELSELEESIRRGVFSDFLNMAARFLEKADQREAATCAGVLAGATLEQYVRQLANLNGIETATSDGEPAKAESLAAELHREGIFDFSEQMQVTAWLNLWSKAAHGWRDEFTVEEVRLMVQGVLELMLRHPA